MWWKPAMMKFTDPPALISTVLGIS